MEVVSLRLEKLGRISNVGEDHVTRILTIGIQNQREFQCGKRHSDIGLHSGRRNIHGYNCGTREILPNALDNGAVQPFDWLSYPGSKKRVDKDIGVEQFQLFFIPIVFVQDDCGRVSERLQNIQIRLGVAFDLLFRCEEKDERKTTFLYQLPRDNETVTSVVSLVAANRRGELVRILKSGFKN